MIDNRDQEKIKALEIELHDAWDEITALRRGENHRIMCLEAEIRSRSAATQVMQEEFELEMMEMREEITRLKRALEFRYDSETVPAVSGDIVVTLRNDDSA